MNLILAIFVGGGTGAVMRHYAGIGARGLLGEAMPYGTLFVNILGSFLIGVIMETFALKANLPGTLQAMLVTGFLGGFTTFSAFSLDVFKLVETGHVPTAALYVAMSVFFSLLAAFAGVYMMRGVLS